MLKRILVPAATFVIGLLIGASRFGVAGMGGQVEEAPAALAASDPATLTPEVGGQVAEPPTTLVSGIGGVFLRAQDPQALQAWYERNLGFEAGPQGIHFLWRHADEPNRTGRTVWSLFPPDTDYFGDPDQQVMVNYIVSDLDLVLARMAEDGIQPVKAPETYAYGRFAWVLDGEGNRIELWEPPADR